MTAKTDLLRPNSAFAALPSSAEMRAFEDRVIGSGVSARELMERAGAAIAARALAMPELSAASSGSKRVVIVCGSGNNGGDGVVLGRILAAKGVEVVIALCSERQLSSQTSEQLELSIRTQKSKAGKDSSPRIVAVEDAVDAGVDRIGIKELSETISNSALVVDAMLGAGQRSAPTGLVAKILATLKDGSTPILAVDLPTGVNPDSGEVYPNAVTATVTVAIEGVKRGLVQHPAREQCGELVVESIGVSVADSEFALLTRQALKKPAKRPIDSHKGLFGPVLALAGSRSMPGAACLVGLAALRAGAGVVHTTSQAATAFAPELIEANFGTFDLADFNGIVVGPGIGTDDAMAKLVEHVLGQRRRTPIIVDADALTIIAANKSYELLSDTIITPHPGEAARLLGCSTADVQRDRYSAAIELGSRTKATVVLKGASTIVFSGSSGMGRGVVNPTGTPWMSTAGSGDVLAGIISALTMQGLERFDAAVAGVALHAACGELASGLGHPIIASDLISKIPEAWDEVFVK
jgi:hydroxyethylthiazole kinase-like uncharacterized protein yjeF